MYALNACLKRVPYIYAFNLWLVAQACGKARGRCARWSVVGQTGGRARAGKCRVHVVWCGVVWVSCTCGVAWWRVVWVSCDETSGYMRYAARSVPNNQKPFWNCFCIFIFFLTTKKKARLVACKAVKPAEFDTSKFPDPKEARKQRRQDFFLCLVHAPYMWYGLNI